MAFPSWSARTGALSGAWLSVATICAAHAMAPTVAVAQSVSGTLSVSATILPPIMTPSADPISFRIERNGTARLETTPPTAGTVSLIVMSTVASSANGFIPVAQPPALVRATHGSQQVEATAGSTEHRASRWHYEIPLGEPSDRSEPHDVTVRITYLIVPGT